MKKHLISSLFIAVLFTACSTDQVEPIAEPVLVPYAIYQLDNPDFDTSAPQIVRSYTYNLQGQISELRLRVYGLNTYDRTSYFNYDQNGKVIFLTQDGIENRRHNFLYEGGQVKYAQSPYGRSEFLYDGANRLRVRIDTTGSVVNPVRADSLLYSYTDSGITIRRIIRYLSYGTEGEAQPNYFFFDKSIKNPFENVKSDLSCLHFSLVDFTSNLRFKQNGFVSKFKMVYKTGRIDINMDNTVVKYKQGSNYPELIKVNHLNFGNSSEYYLYILYREY
jgi:hypothetical protein